MWSGGFILYLFEVVKVVEYGLFVKRVFGDVYDDGVVDKVAYLVGFFFRV